MNFSIGGVAGARTMLLPTRQLNFIAARAEQFRHQLPVIPLDFNALRTDRTACSARALKFPGQLGQFCRRPCKPQHHCYRFTAPPLRFAPYAHKTIRQYP